MDERLVRRQVERLARAFAERVVAAAVRAPVFELDEVLTRAMASPPRRESTHEKPKREAQTRVNGARATHEEAPSRRSAPPPPESDEPETFANVITDPSLLLDVIESTPTLPAAPPRVPRPRAAPELLTQAVALRGPALRPGERLERTARGSVILRRGRT
jgi:hypothetical protein